MDGFNLFNDDDEAPKSTIPYTPSTQSHTKVPQKYTQSKTKREDYNDEEDMGVFNLFGDDDETPKTKLTNPKSKLEVASKNLDNDEEDMGVLNLFGDDDETPKTKSTSSKIPDTQSQSVWADINDEEDMGTFNLFGDDDETPKTKLGVASKNLDNDEEDMGVFNLFGGDDETPQSKSTNTPNTQSNINDEEDFGFSLFDE